MCRRVRAAGAIAALLVVALVPSVPAQEKKPDAPPGARQDKADLPALLDSWYKVVQGTPQGPEHVGYVRERLSRQVVGASRYDYHVNVDIEMMVPDAKDASKKALHTESRQVDARLDDTYAPQSLKQTDIRNGVEVVTSVFSEETGKRIDVSVAGAEPRPHKVTPEEEVHYSRALMFIFLRQNEFLSRPGTRRAILFHPMEDDRSPLVEVQLDVQEMSKRDYLGKKDLSVTRVVYIKPPPAATREAELLETYVDKYGRILEETTRGNLKRIIAKDEQEALGPPRLRPLARRDPFVRPRLKAAGAKDEGVEAVKETVVDDIAKAIKDMQKLVEELQKANNEGRESDVEKFYQEFLLLFVAAHRYHQTVKPMAPAEQAQVALFRQQAEAAGKGLERLMKRLRALYVEIGQRFEREECVEMEKGIGELKKVVVEEKVLQEMPELQEVNRWIGELEPLVTKCRTRQELARKKLLVSGTTLHDHVEMVAIDPSVVAFGHTLGTPLELKFVRPNRMVVINTKTYRVGDVVEGEGVRVEKIWAHGVQVSLREEMRDVPIRQ